MKKVEHYICEICHTEYVSEKACEECEASHKTDLTIKEMRYVPHAQNRTGLPVSITIEYQDGKYKKTAVYKR